MSSTLRTIFRTDPTTDVISTYNILSTLTSYYPTTIVTRWRKKTVALRTKCLSRAWEAANGSANKNVPERRPRLGDTILEAKLIPELEIDEFLYACINIEQLATNPAALLNLICSRSVRHPSAFGRWDYRWSVKPVLEMFGLIGGDGQRKGKVNVVVIAGNEDEYGVLKSYKGGSRDYSQDVDRMVICPVEVEGTYLMRWQKTILEFCLAVVRDIISPIDPKKKNPVTTGSESITTKLLENVPNYSLSGGDLESYSASVLLRPYIIPPDPSIEDILHLAVSHLRAAEDHLDLLHTSPNYFIAQVENQLTHRPENIPAESPLAVHDALRRALYNAYAISLIWSEICLALEDSKLQNESKTDLFITINPLLTFLGAIPETELGLHFLAAGESKTENVANSLLMCLHPSGSSIYSNWLTLPRIAVEIEHALADSPLLKSQIDPWVMNILSSIAAISEIREVICQLEPSSSADDQAGTKFGETVQTLSQLWEKVELGSFSNVPGLRESIVGDGLERFWEHVSVEFVKCSGKTLAEWTLSKQRRIVSREKKGRWHWQGDVWVSDKICDEEFKKEEDRLPELVRIAEWDDVNGYGEQRPAHSNGGVVPKMVEALTNMQGGDVQFATTRRGVKRIISDVRGIKQDPTKKISVNKRMHSSIIQLSNGTPLSWKDFVHLMTNLGFTIEHIGGSLVRFIPATERDEAIIVKRPHGQSVLQSLDCVSTWTRLEMCYGWKVGIFEKETNAAEVKAAG